MAEPKLPGTSATRRRGVVERAAATDLSRLREVGAIPDGSGALEATYRRLAAAVDRANRDEENYHLVNAARELRQTRERLGSTTSPAEDDALEDLLARISEAIEQ